MIHSYPWYLQEWMVSRARAVLNLEQRGLYREIIDVLYSHEGVVDNSDELLRKLCAAEPKEFKRAWPAVKAFLDEVDGKISHPKIREVIEKLEKYHSSRVAAGKNGAHRRYSSASSKPVAKLEIEHSLPQPPPQPLPLPLPEISAEPDPDQPRTLDLTVRESVENSDRLSEVVSAIHLRHPKLRSCGPAEIRKLLTSITSKSSPKDRAALLERINANHAAWCETPEWQKDDGQFAKGLANWLAPKMNRYLDAPSCSDTAIKPPPPKQKDWIPDYDREDAEFQEAKRNGTVKEFYARKWKQQSH